jgi:hypothetical protein
MRYRQTLFVMMLVAMQAQAGRKLTVLFIGNSYTYFNNMPQLVANFAASVGDTLVFDSYAIGGASFADHVTLSGCLQKIQSANWDLIVLQEQSLKPAVTTGTFFNDSYHWAGVLDTMIADNDPCTEKMFYMTWGRKNGDSILATIQGIPANNIYQGMDSLISARYFALADTSIPPTMGITLLPGAWFSPIRLSQLSPVGAVWHYIRDTYPGIELYDADESHPSPAGSYAAACTFYASLFRKDPALSAYNSTLPAADAASIKQAVKLRVFDSLHLWYIGTHDLRSQFRWQWVGGGDVILINESSGTMTGFQWDLGDGTTSTSGTFFHNYATQGTYTVRLIATDGNCTDTSYGVVTVGPNSVGNTAAERDVITIAPNPSSGNFIIHMPQKDAQVTVLNMYGQVVYVAKADGRLQVDIRGQAAGVYVVRVIGEDVAWEGKVVVE